MLDKKKKKKCMELTQFVENRVMLDQKKKKNCMELEFHANFFFFGG